ncbi:hypothetical protein ILUMI_24042 [Ignelater luminosus]|uniref:Angiogenic factor with G patch and FHA domains 1 n=1 Tax=Ignelater luminosus TaxID=2038154 RepID=A0A8K0FWP8_IGNLU|nr:hypothetical protein ILUMI_24042 [Ignelater luminosus]
MDLNLKSIESEMKENNENDTACVLPSYCDLSDALQEQLKEHYPDVLEIISALRRFIEKQQIKIRKLRAKLKRNATQDVATQTDNFPEETANISKLLSEDIKEAAEMAMQNTGFVYEKTSGLYYDYTSGYYYNAELGLYYDGNTGTYMTYNTETQSYDFHSQVDVVPNSAAHQAQDDSCTRSKRKSKDRENSKGYKRVRPAASCQTQSDLEEGECSDSSHEDEVSGDESDETNHSDHAEIARAWPPCMRIIVKSTSVSKLKEGTLFIVTYEGGTLGREGNHSILIPDINISKHHLRFSFDKDTGHYLITDLGSRNGTLLNGKRISASKQESEPTEVVHGSHIQIGSTILLCHIHLGNETCGHCEPGLLQTNNDVKESTTKLNKNERHKNELRQLRKKFGINSSEGNTQLAAGYTDRAQVRRQTVGSQNEHEKTQVASVDQSISSDNKGFKLLSKMGWSEGQSLGKEGTGVLNPIELKTTVGTTGIGYTGTSTASDKPQHNATKPNVWEKTQKRYQQLSSSPSTSHEDYDLE